MQRANARIRRLEQLGFLGRARQFAGQEHAVFLTGRGHELLGLARRRAPRAQVQREHEAAIVDLAIELERRAGSATMLLSERQCRRAETLDRDQARRFSVPVSGAPRGDERRWPDLVLDGPGGRVAVEIELTPKSGRRLAAIVRGYRRSPYVLTVFVVRGVALERRLRGLVAEPHSELAGHLGLRRRELVVLEWAVDASRLAAQIDELQREHVRCGNGGQARERGGSRAS